MTIKSDRSFQGHSGTKFIKIDTSQCQACWKCVQACPNHVLGKVVFFKHRHVRVDRAEACKGCKKCVRACPNNAISYLYLPTPRESLSDQDDCSQNVEGE